MQSECYVGTLVGNKNYVKGGLFMKEKKSFFIIATICSIVLLFCYYMWGIENAALYMLFIWILKDILSSIFEKK